MFLFHKSTISTHTYGSVRHTFILLRAAGHLLWKSMYQQPVIGCDTAKILWGFEWKCQTNNNNLEALSTISETNDRTKCSASLVWFFFLLSSVSAGQVFVWSMMGRRVWTLTSAVPAYLAASAASTPMAPSGVSVWMDTKPWSATPTPARPSHVIWLSVDITKYIPNGERNKLCNLVQKLCHYVFLSFFSLVEEPLLILADHHEIRKLSVDGSNYTILKQVRYFQWNSWKHMVVFVYFNSCWPNMHDELWSWLKVIETPISVLSSFFLFRHLYVILIHVYVCFLVLASTSAILLFKVFIGFRVSVWIAVRVGVRGFG